jgi:phosphatidylglycerol:prolipoprotein diacylglycerol transferase
MRPPTSPYLLDALFGLPWLSVRWYGVLIMGGALLAALLAARRARARGFDPDHVWNQLLLGLLLAIPLARAYYVAFAWPRYVGRPWLEIINPQGGGLAMHGGLLGALLAVVIYTRRQHLPLWASYSGIICQPGRA